MRSKRQVRTRHILTREEKLKITIFVKNPIAVLSICPHNSKSTLTHPECCGQIQRSLLFSILYVLWMLDFLFFICSIASLFITTANKQQPKKNIYPIENMEPCLLLAYPIPYCESVRIYGIHTLCCVCALFYNNNKNKTQPQLTNTQTPNDTKKVSTNAINHLFSTSQ